MTDGSASQRRQADGDQENGSGHRQQDKNHAAEGPFVDSGIKLGPQPCGDQHRRQDDEEHPQRLRRDGPAAGIGDQGHNMHRQIE